MQWNSNAVPVVIVCVALGDAHASERIGPSCAAFQTTVSVIEIAAVYHGATLEQLRHLHEAFRPCVVRYHGRVGLFDYMFRQVCIIVDFNAVWWCHVIVVIAVW